MVRDFRLLIMPRFLPTLTAVSHFLNQQKVVSYLVGGFVRDSLLGRVTADIDIAVARDALEIAPEVAAILGGRYVLLDEVNRVGRVVMVNGEGRWQLDFSTLEGSLEPDMARRDFTINALAVDLGQLAGGATGIPVIDLFGGLSDLERGVVRAVTEKTFELDAVRLLRAVRLAAELGFSIDAHTEALVRHHARLVDRVAGERIREELLRLLAVPGRQFLPYLDELGLLTTLVPELARMKGVKQPKEHYWDVFDHTLEMVAAVDFLLRRGVWDYAGGELLAVVPWSAGLAEHFECEVSHGSTRRLMLKIAALFHDLAKPQTRTVEATGRIRFLGHAKEGAVVAAGILERLRFSAREIRLVETMVEHHLRPGQLSHVGLPTSRAIYRYFRDTGEAGIDVLFLSLADHLATRGPQLDLGAWQEHARMVAYVLAERFKRQSLVTPPKLVDGHDVINTFGLSPGPEVGKILEAVREAQAAGEVTTRQDALSYIREHLLSKGVNIYG